MFLITAKWQDNSDSIFLVGKDPTNKKLPNWTELFTKPPLQLRSQIS